MKSIGTVSEASIRIFEIICERIDTSSVGERYDANALNGRSDRSSKRGAYLLLRRRKRFITPAARSWCSERRDVARRRSYSKYSSIVGPSAIDFFDLPLPREVLGFAP